MNCYARAVWVVSGEHNDGEEGEDDDTGKDDVEEHGRGDGVAGPEAGEVLAPVSIDGFWAWIGENKIMN